MYSRYADRVNAQRLSRLFGKAGRRSPEEKSCAHSLSSSRNRSGADLRQNLKDIWEALETEGLHVNYHTFYMVVWRARGKSTAASNWGKQDRPPEAQGLQETKAERVERRDPFANLGQLEVIS